jgi:hypothetical protein
MDMLLQLDVEGLSDPVRTEPTTHMASKHFTFSGIGRRVPTTSARSVDISIMEMSIGTSSIFGHSCRIRVGPCARCPSVFMAGSGEKTRRMAIEWSQLRTCGVYRDRWFGVRSLKETAAHCQESERVCVEKKMGINV